MNYDKVKRSGKEYFRYRHWDGVLKKYDETLYAPTLKELKQKYEYFAEKEMFGIKDDDILFSQFFKHWLNDVHIVGKKPKTISRYMGLSKNYIENSYVSKKKLKDLSSEDFQKWYNEIFEEKGANTIKNLHKLVRPALRYAFETGRTLKNYGAFLNVPKSFDVLYPEDKIHPLTLSEHMQFINAIKGHPLEALFNTAIDTGMRQGELFALRWSDINFKNKSIRINKTFSYDKDLKSGRYVGVVTQPKTPKSIRMIPLPNRTESILLNHKNSQKEMFLRAGLKQEEINLVFTTVIGSHLNSQNVLKRVQKVYKECEIEKKTFHDLRHTYATRLFELGEDPKVVQKLLGHSTVFMTLETYTHVLESLKQKTATKIDSLYTTGESDFCSIGQFSDNYLNLIK
ncbi:MAG: site-specific integrase [Eubacterium sp.]